MKNVILQCLKIRFFVTTDAFDDSSSDRMVEERRLEVVPDAAEAVQPAAARASVGRPPFRDRAEVGHRRKAEGRGRAEQSGGTEAIRQRFIFKIVRFKASPGVRQMA